MSMSGLYKCTGCGLEFKSIDEWRKGDASQNGSDEVNGFQILSLA